MIKNAYPYIFVDFCTKFIPKTVYIISLCIRYVPTCSVW